MNRSRRSVLLLAAILFASALFAAMQRKAPSKNRGSAAAMRPASPGQHRAELARENNLGVALMNRQQFDAALGHFQRVCVLDSESDIGCLNMGIALLNSQHYGKARQALATSSERDPKSARAWYNLGLLEKSQGHAEAAIQDFHKATALDPSDADTQYFLGLLYSQQQQYAPAIAAFQSALRLNPFHASAEFGLAQAEMRSGNSEAARRDIAQFQHVTAAHLGTPISAAYGEQGKYSLAEALPPWPEPAPPAIPVHLEDVTRAAGLRSFAVPQSPSTVFAQNPRFPHNEHRRAIPRFRVPGVTEPAPSLAGFLGSGACVIDYDGDGKPDLLLLNADGRGSAALYHNVGGKFVDATKQSKLDIRGALGCAVGDYDNDGRPDLAVSFPGHITLYHNDGNRSFSDVTAKAGIRADAPDSAPASGGAPLDLGLTFIDFDHDGDLDLYVTRFNNFPLESASLPFLFPWDARAPGNVLWRNNGNGTFTEWTKPAGLEGTGPSVGVIGSDVNNDRATDFVVTGWKKQPDVLLNPREGQFRAANPFTSALPGPTAGVAALDFNKDGWMDLAFTHWSPPGISLWRNVEGKSFARVPLPDLGWMRGWGIAALDYDNDGWVDLVAVGDTFSGEGRIALLRNEGPAGFRDVTHETGLDKIRLRNPRAVIPLDFDGDGTTDLLVTQNGAPPVLLKNIGANRNRWVRLAFAGTNDNKSGIGTKVEMYAGSDQQKWEIPGASGYLGQGSFDIVAGLGSYAGPDVVRMLWPTGVLQDELNQPGEKRDLLTEIDRRGSSCPIVFVWNGRKFQFLSDIIGPGIVGHWIAPNQRNTPDPEEYLKVRGSDVAAVNGRIRFRLLEPMEELDYLDQVRLLAVDHPEDEEVWPNARFATNPPFPKFKVIAVRPAPARHSGAHPPLGAWDDHGRDVLPLLLRRDRRYVAGFAEEPFAGFAKMHSLTLDLGPWDAHRPIRLILDGFTDYFSASSMYAAWQAGISPVPPYVEALDPASGKWVRVVDDMGFPAGLARTMIADLTGKLPPGTRRVRITTNLKIYWDRIRVDNSPADLPYRVSEVPLTRADLRFRGYPRVVEHHPKNDLTYIYEDVSLTGPYGRQTGNYTRYGDVAALLRASDDEYVIFGSGDEIAADFDASHLPAPPRGWTRDYFLYADGFAKDMDFYAKYGGTVSPLPFHTLAPYPYPEGVNYPQDEKHLEYLLDWNTRPVAGPATPLFRFSYPRR